MSAEYDFSSLSRTQLESELRSAKQQIHSQQEKIDDLRDIVDSQENQLMYYESCNELGKSKFIIEDDNGEIYLLDKHSQYLLNGTSSWRFPGPKIQSIYFSLITRPNIIVPNDILLYETWEIAEFEPELHGPRIWMTVSYLRKFLGMVDPVLPRHIVTRSGEGYSWEGIVYPFDSNQEQIASQALNGV